MSFMSQRRTNMLSITPLLVCLSVFASVGQAQEPPKTAAAPSNGRKVFEQMKSLAGSWRGTIMDIPINFMFRPTSSGTTILLEMHTEGGNPPNHEITMFYLEAD